ncbi:DMT family transporter [Acuticoccus sediminis]|uniref:DMT family transporter n=1 Tax=Acuticoccus sediminis TaxID=2184697 RepID=UPI001CFDFAA1|nr:DMT family transporter [Acuticoccus sediminis]
MPLNDNARGALIMTAAMAGFTCNDAAMKLAFENVPVAQGIFARGVMSGVLILLLAWRTGALGYRPTRRGTVVIALRSACELGSTITFLQALAVMPLATASSVLQFVPLAVTMVAALLFREPVGWRRWSAIAVGFVGVMVMIRPGGEAFDTNILYPLGTVAFITVRDMLTRSLDPDTPSVFASVVTIVAVTVFAGALMPAQGTVGLDQATAIVILVASTIILVGYILSITAMRVGDISAVSPFRYTGLLWAMLLGYFVFDEVPDGPTFIGAGLVVAAGLYTLWRETLVGRGHPAASASTRPFSASDGGA